MTSNGDQARALAQTCQREFRRRMAGEYVPRIRQCLTMLTEAQIWHRPGPRCNSIGNLLLHLEGNVRQWIQGGIDGQRDQRQRDQEFAAGRDPAGRASGRNSGLSASASSTALIESLARTVDEACSIVDRLSPSDLVRDRPFQGGRYQESVLAAVLHVLEHFSGHAGQIYFWTKQTTGRDLHFYDL